MMFRHLIIVWFTCILSLAGCSLPTVEKMPVTSVEVRKWSKSLLPPHESLEAHPLDENLKQTAALGQTAMLERITGRHGDIFDGGFFRNKPEPLHVVADMPCILPIGPPTFIRAESTDELESRAGNSKTDIYYVTMKTIGSAEIDGRRGPVIEYRNNVVDWEQAAWKLLGEDERSRRTQPVFRQWLFGAWARYAIVRDGSRLIIYEGGMVVS